MCAVVLYCCSPAMSNLLRYHVNFQASIVRVVLLLSCIAFLSGKCVMQGPCSAVHVYIMYRMYTCYLLRLSIYPPVHLIICPSIHFFRPSIHFSIHRSRLNNIFWSHPPSCNSGKTNLYMMGSKKTYLKTHLT